MPHNKIEVIHYRIYKGCWQASSKTQSSVKGDVWLDYREQDTSVNFTLLRACCSGLTKWSSSTRAVSEICWTLGLKKSQLSSGPQQISQHFVLSEVGKALKWVSNCVRPQLAISCNLAIIFHLLSDVTKQASRVYTQNRSTWLPIPISTPTLLDIIFNSR